MINKLQCVNVVLILFLAISFQTSFAQVTLKATSEKKNYSRPTRLAFDFINNDNQKVNIMTKITSNSSLVINQKQI
jgi:hypothetical protein